ncbi:hypothetical protein T459_30331 [Capsicum annuum]|uniref:Uncharacterized protein n=1 Tax=Capsicum annuum TaxID=4072 RepID=A0A2G2Y813_CAPAN|nr:hypothetical protein T459_30331 [Capsicum annuum]
MSTFNFRQSPLSLTHASSLTTDSHLQLQLLRLDYIHQMLSNKLFNIQLKKSSWVSDNVTRTSLTIVLVTENEQVLPLAIDQRIAKKVRPLATSEQEMEPRIVESGSSSATLALEPLMPAKITKVFIYERYECHGEKSISYQLCSSMSDMNAMVKKALVINWTKGVKPELMGDPCEIVKPNLTGDYLYPMLAT